MLTWLHVLELIRKKEKQENIIGLTDGEVAEHFGSEYYNMTRIEAYTIINRLHAKGLLKKPYKKSNKWQLTPRAKKILVHKSIYTFLDPSYEAVQKAKEKAKRRGKRLLLSV